MGDISFQVKVPTRVDLAGGTLDIWPIYCLVGGAKTINVAIDLFVTASFESKSNEELHITLEAPSGEKLSLCGPLSDNDIKLLPLPLRFPGHMVSQYLTSYPSFRKTRVQIRYSCQAPLKSGLGGSSSLALALVKGLSQISGELSEPGWQWKILAWVRDAEAHFLKNVTGTQDYLAALFGGLACYESHLGNIQIRGYPETAFDELAERMLVLFSEEMHDSGLSNWEVFKRTLDGDPGVVSAFQTLKALGEEVHQLINKGKDIAWKDVGSCLEEDWRIRKNVFRVQTSRLDQMLDYIKREGILGARVCGAAQGGSLMALVAPDRLSELKKKCERSRISVLSTHATRQGISISSTSPLTES